MKKVTCALAALWVGISHLIMWFGLLFSFLSAIFFMLDDSKFMAVFAMFSAVCIGVCMTNHYGSDELEQFDDDEDIETGYF